MNFTGASAVVHTVARFESSESVIELLPVFFIASSSVVSVVFEAFTSVSMSFAPGTSSEPLIAFLLISISDGLSIISTSVPETRTPFSTSKLIVSSLNVYPSGDVVSVSVYLPSGSPLITAAVSPDVNTILSADEAGETAPPPTLISLRFAPSSAASLSSIVRTAPGSSSVPLIAFLLTVTSESLSIITILLPVVFFTAPFSIVNWMLSVT